MFGLTANASVSLTSIVGMIMKRVLLVLPFVLAACAGDVTEPRDVAVKAGSVMSASSATCTVPIAGVLTVVSKGFDQYGYNRCAHIFNGTYEGYCTERKAPSTCGDVEGSTKLVMKWNEEWDRGNATGWKAGPYDAYLDNEVKGTDLDGNPVSGHFKIKWDAGCALNGISAIGGVCYWTNFVILMDQGMADGKHVWLTKFSPAGYGN